MFLDQLYASDHSADNAPAPLYEISIFSCFVFTAVRRSSFSQVGSMELKDTMASIAFSQVKGIDPLNLYFHRGEYGFCWACHRSANQHLHHR